MSNISYMGLVINTIFNKGQDYLELSCSIRLMDEQSGHEEDGGCITTIVLSDQWGTQNVVSIATGMDAKLKDSIRCLELYDLFVGKVAVILECGTVGKFRAFEDQAFIDLTHYLDQAMHVDHTITLFPFNRSVKSSLGYKRTWGPDKRSYSIKTIRHFESVKYEDATIEYDENTSVLSGPIYNKLRIIPSAEYLERLSEDAKEIIVVLSNAGGRALTKAMILEGVTISEEHLSLAMLELIENDLLEETTEPKAEDNTSSTNGVRIGESLLKEVQNRNVEKVREMLSVEGANIDELTEDGRNALFIAIENKDTKMVEVLLQGGVDPNYESYDGTTALKMCWRSQNRSIEKLLGQYGAEIGFE